MGVEPTSKAWEAFILPMNYARKDFISIAFVLLFDKGEFALSIANYAEENCVLM